MTISKIKDKCEEIRGKKIIAKVSIGRNKYEIFEGIIDEIYPFLFTIKLGDEIKSFSYADILTKNIIIKLI